MFHLFTDFFTDLLIERVNYHNNRRIKVKLRACPLLFTRNKPLMSLNSILCLSFGGQFNQSYVTLFQVQRTRLSHIHFLVYFQQLLY